jgi:hypothetical protein
MTTDADVERVRKYANESGVGTPSAEDLYINKLRTALVHAAYRTHPFHPGGCDACAQVAALLERGEDGLP